MDPGDIAAEKIVFPLINMMMARVARRRDGPHFKWRDAHEVVILQDRDAISRDRLNPPPKPFHFVAIKPSGGGDELCRIDQVRRAARMHVNGRPELGEPPGRAGMIEMNVTEKDMPDIVNAETSFRQLRGDGLEGRFRSRVEKDQTIIRLERGCRDDAAPAEMLSIEDMDHG